MFDVVVSILKLVKDGFHKLIEEYGIFPRPHAVGQLVVHLPSRLVSHPKDNKLP